LLKTHDQRKTGTAFGNKEIVFFGYDTAFNGAMNMAIDEVLLKRSDTEDRFFVRFYDVGKPTVILSSSDNYKSVIKTADDGIDVCRRITGGRPIYLDQNTIEYSIAGPLRKDGELNGIFDLHTKIHRSFGPMLAATINDMIGNNQEISFGNTSSIRINNKPIAGHAHMTRPNRSFLYHGVVVIRRWDLKMIDKILRLPDEDLKQIPALPNIHDLAKSGNGRQYKDELIRKFSDSLPRENVKLATGDLRLEILRDADDLYKVKYSADWWTFKDVKASVARFCLLES
jgi:lipoate-protein ligase A